MAGSNTSKTSESTTQEFLEVYDITNNLVVLKNGTVSVALTVSAINFGLLAEEEQDAVMYAYAGLLNSLNYPIEIVIHSQTKDVTKYLSLLKDQEDVEVSPLIKRRIQQYREFVANLIQERNVLDKKFYVVIPATGLELGFVSPKGFIPGQTEINLHDYERSVIVEKAKSVLDPRRDHLVAQFARIGLYARELETQELIQLFYIRYNPEAVEGQQLEESSSYTSPLVSAQVHESVYNQMVHQQSDVPVPEISQPQPFDRFDQMDASTVSQDAVLAPSEMSAAGDVSQALEFTPDAIESTQTEIPQVPSDQQQLT